MEKDTMSKVLWAVGIIVVIVVVILLIVKGNKGPVAPESQGDQNAETALTPKEDVSAGSINAPKANATTPAALLSYEQALAKYGTNRIQFGNRCEATPTTMTFKQGTDIMIDNRAGVDRTFNINGKFTVKAYGFKIVDISASNLPRQIMVDCDGQQNVASILVQP
jgi:hypothetical protein